MNHVLPRVYTSVAALLFSVTTSAQLFGSGASTVVGPNAYAVATALT